MRPAPINPPLRSGQTVLCSKCGRMSANAVADLDARPFTFLCAGCVPTFNPTALYVYHGGAGGDSYLCGACIAEGYRKTEADPEAYRDRDIPLREHWAQVTDLPPRIVPRDGCDDCGLAAMPNPNPED